MRIDKLAHTDAIAFDELSSKAYDGEFDAEFPPNGNFQKVSRTSKATGVEKEFWYYYGYHKSGPDSGTRYSKYAGSTSDPEVNKRVEAFGEAKDDYKVRRRMVNQLKQAGMPSPSPIEGDVVRALAEAGLFRVNGMLVGSVAYQTYSGLLGAKLPREAMRTTDVDFAQDHGISVNIGDATPDLFDVLKKVDPTFRAVPHISDKTGSNAFENRERFKVEFLTTNRGSDEIGDHLSRLPALGGIAAIPLRHMDFLVRDPVRSVMLHDGGISVKVPAPHRYAIHKMIVSAQRGVHALTKSDKDADQASSLILAHDLTRKGYLLTEAWMEAWERGPRWREDLARGALKLDPEALGRLHEHVTLASNSHGFKEGAAPEKSMAQEIPRPRQPQAKNDRSEDRGR